MCRHNPLLKPKAVHPQSRLLHAGTPGSRNQHCRQKRKKQRQSCVKTGIIKRNHKGGRPEQYSDCRANTQRRHQLIQKRRGIHLSPARLYRHQKLFFIHPFPHFFLPGLLAEDVCMGFTFHAAASRNRTDSSKIHAPDTNIHVFPLAS